MSENLRELTRAEITTLCELLPLRGSKILKWSAVIKDFKLRERIFKKGDFVLIDTLNNQPYLLVSDLKDLSED